MIPTFDRLCQSQSLLPPAGGRVLVAVSGGADSMCLLSLLLAAGARDGFQVEAAHFDHRIRPESAADAQFVVHWCRSHGVPCHLGSGNIPALAAERKQGLEETARHFRYRFLEETAQRCGADVIATAHNASDNAETLLLHLLRGTGLAGLGGIAPRRGKLIRPLLTTSRQDIEAYNARHHIPHVEDATNGDTAYTRNFLRHQVMPLLSQRNPNLTDTLCRTAAALRADEAYLSDQAARLAAQATEDALGLRLPAAALAEAPLALSSRALQQLATRLSPETVLPAAQRSAVLALCRSADPSGKVSLSGGLQALRVYDDLLLAPLPPEDFSPVALAAPGVTDTPLWRFRTELVPCPSGKFNQPHSFYLVPGDYVLRPRQGGDRITLPARPAKTVKKLLNECKLPRHLRPTLPVVVQGDRVAALTGFGADCAFLPAPGAPALHVETEAIAP